jgi:glucuronokinase
MIIKRRSYPRAALIGNPSDGYFGKTIAFVFKNFSADITLYQTPELEIVHNTMDHTIFDSIEQLYEDVRMHGYYGGIRLLKAAVKKFYEYCRENGIQLDKRNFTIRYDSNIPIRLGLAGSSAIITACMKALMAFYNISIPKPVLANMVLSVETDELCIPAGLQDRVAQAYEKPVFMDFSRDLMEKQGYGHYEELNASTFPNLYIGYRIDLSEGTEVVHNDFRARYIAGDKNVTEAIRRWAQLTVEFKECLERKNYNKIGDLINENFDIRKNVMNISQKNIEMVDLARSVGAAVKFTGSGGAIIGTYKDEAMFNELCRKLQKISVEVIKPEIVV